MRSYKNIKFLYLSGLLCLASTHGYGSDLPAPKKPRVSFFGSDCPASLAKDFLKAKKDMATVLFCLNKNYSALEQGKKLPDSNFVNALSSGQVSRALQQFKGSQSYLQKIKGLVDGKVSKPVAMELPEAKAPRIRKLGCASKLLKSEGSMHDNLPEILFCIDDNAENAKDTNFIKALQQPFVKPTLQKYKGSEDYLKKLAQIFAPRKFEEKGPEAPLELPEARKPRLPRNMACRASILKTPQDMQKNMSTVLFCIDENQDGIKDKNFVNALQAPFVKETLEKYQGGDGYVAKIQQIFTSLKFKEAAPLELPEARKPRLPRNMACRASILKTPQDMQKNMSTVLFCIDENQDGIKDKNFVKALEANFVKGTFEKYQGSEAYLDKIQKIFTPQQQEASEETAATSLELPEAQKPRFTPRNVACRASILKTPQDIKKNMPTILFCIDENQEEIKDDNFVKALAVPHVLRTFKEYANADTYIDTIETLTGIKTAQPDEAPAEEEPAGPTEEDQEAAPAGDDAPVDDAQTEPAPLAEQDSLSDEDDIKTEAGDVADPKSLEEDDKQASAPVKKGPPEKQIQDTVQEYVGRVAHGAEIPVELGRKLRELQLSIGGKKLVEFVNRSAEALLNKKGMISLTAEDPLPISVPEGAQEVDEETLMQSGLAIVKSGLMTQEQVEEALSVRYFYVSSDFDISNPKEAHKRLNDFINQTTYRGFAALSQEE